MAYLAFDEIGIVQQGGASSDGPVHAPELGRLTALEWAVVALARRDRLATLRVPGRLSAALGKLFGTRANPRLADPRLETLRRVAVLAWHGGVVVPAGEIADFLAAGFTPGHYDTMLAGIAATGEKRTPQA